MPGAPLTLHARGRNPRHAHLSVFQAGGLAGKLIVDRAWWDALSADELHFDVEVTRAGEAGELRTIADELDDVATDILSTEGSARGDQRARRLRELAERLRGPR